MPGSDPAPDIPFERYRSRIGHRVVWAKKVPTAFNIRVSRGIVDQRRAGAQRKIEYVEPLAGEAGDYLVLVDDQLGTRRVLPGDVFEQRFVLDESDK